MELVYKSLKDVTHQIWLTNFGFQETLIFLSIPFDVVCQNELYPVITGL